MAVNRSWGQGEDCFHLKENSIVKRSLSSIALLDGVFVFCRTDPLVEDGHEAHHGGDHVDDPRRQGDAEAVGVAADLGGAVQREEPGKVLGLVEEEPDANSIQDHCKIIKIAKKKKKIRHKFLHMREKCHRI